MIYTIRPVIRNSDNTLWFSIIQVIDGEFKDSFDNREDAERYVAHLESEDSKHLFESERNRR